MQNDERKPWDDRLIEWMQRGSGGPEDRARRPMTSKQAAFFAALYLVWAVIAQTTYWYVFAGLWVANFARVALRERGP
jgi:hypothetical protein